MDIQIWDFNKGVYEPYWVPKDMKVILFSSDMEEEINCTSCFKPMEYGNSYTSKRIHNRVGLGYPVCESCYKKENEEEKKAENEK